MPEFLKKVLLGLLFVAICLFGCYYALHTIGRI
jgi:hypothetical protein